MTAHNLHDKFFKKLMQDKTFFIQTCKTHLPKKLVKAIDWPNIELYKIGGEFVTEASELGKPEEERADIMYLVKLQQEQAVHDGILIFNYEHFSTPRKLLPLITASYALSAVKEYAATQQIEDNLPVVVSVTYYHGKITPYPHTLDLAQLFSQPKLARDYLLKPLLIDLGQYSDEDICQHGLIAPAELMFKRAMHDGLSLGTAKRIAKLIQQHFPQETFPALVMTMIQYGLYLADTDKKQFIDTLLNGLPGHTGEIMSVAEQLKQEGANETARQIALNLMNVLDDPKAIAKATKLPLSEIKRLAKTAKATNDK